MIPIEKCKELLSDETLTDAEVAKIRNYLYGITETIPDDYFDSKVVETK